MENAKAREALIAEFDRHIKEEDDIVQAYHQLADKLGSGPLGVLVNHIATDEEMHHFLLRTLSDWLRSPPAPDAGFDAEGLDRDAILGQVHVLQEHETITIKACGDLKTQLSGEGEIFEALLEAIALDSKKHHRLLAMMEKIIKG